MQAHISKVERTKYVPTGRRWVVSFAAVAIAAISGSTVHGNTVNGDYANPQVQYLDFLSLSIRERMYVRSDSLMTIGDSSGLSWIFRGHKTDTSGDYHGDVSTDDLTNEIWVRFGDEAVSFIPSGSSFINGAGNGATLTSPSAGNYIYTSNNGTVYTFSGGVLSTVLYPNGTKQTYNYSAATSVVSNTGFAFKFDSSGTGNIKAVNMLAHSCDSAALSCDAYDNYLTLAQGSTDPDLSGTGGKWSITDSYGNAWKYRIYFSYVYRNPHDPEDVERGPPVLFVFKDPSGYLVKLTNDSSGSVTAIQDPRGNFNVSSSGVTDSSAATVYSISSSSSGATQYLGILDPYGHGKTATIVGSSTSSYYATPTGYYERVTAVAYSEGNRVDYTYDARGNVTQAVNTPKSGSGLSAVTVYRAGYDATCFNLKTCNQPNWTKDAVGNETDYTYDGTHGGVLTVTLPPNQNGLYQRTYNIYTAYNTGNGNIYRLTRTETCPLTSGQLGNTSCSGISPTSVTTTDYGNSTNNPYMYKSFSPYQVTQTDGAGSVSATTTYGYDVIGNVVSVDGPRTDVDDTSYKTYDANRRVIFEIGVDPDGSGSIKRTMTKHTYNGAGHEIQTEIGSGNSTNGTDFTVASFTRMTYDTAGRVIKTEVVQP